MFKKTMKRFITLILAIMMVISLVPASVFAANGTVTGSHDSNIELTYNGESAWTANGMDIVGAVQGSDKVGCSAASSKTSTLTIKNNRNTDAVLSFRYQMTLNGGTLSIDGVNITKNGIFSKELAAGESINVVLTSDKSSKEASIQITELTLVANIEVNVTFEYTANGSFSIDGQKILQTTEIKKNAIDGYAASAVPDNNYKFLGWYSKSEQRYISRNASTTLKIETDQTVLPVFVEKTVPVFETGGEIFTDLEDATIYAQNKNNDTITLIDDGILSEGSYIIPSGITLFIPFNSAHTVYTTEPASVNSYTRPTFYKTLTIDKNAEIVVENGASISISGMQSSAQGTMGAPTGPVGHVVMRENSAIILKSGANLYAWGFITGSNKSMITAEKGSSVYEDLQVSGFRGGNATSSLGLDSNKKKVFPFSQYHVQNIESPLKVCAGAKEVVSTAVTTGFGTSSAQATFIGTEGIFNIDNGYLIKKYDSARDRLDIDVYGNVKLNYLSVDVGTKINSSAFVFPINSNISISIFENSNIDINYDVSFLPGVELYAGQNASVTIAEGADVFIYDRDEWQTGNYAVQNAKFKNISYSPTKTYTRSDTDLKDVILDLDGTLFINGDIYTTANGADIKSSAGTGKIVFNNVPDTGRKLYEAVQSGNTIADYPEIPTTPAQLHNADGSYTQTTDAAIGDIYAYYNGEWYKTHKIVWQNDDEAKTELAKAEHQFRGTDVTYSGETPSKAEDAQYTYTFSGWKDSAGNTIEAGASAAVTKDEIYTAVFTPITRSYTVTWKDGDDKVIKTESLDYGTTPAYSGDIPAKTQTDQYNYVFEDKWSPEITSVTGDAVYTAQFTPVTRTYTVTWKNEDGTILETDENVPYGTKPSYNGATPEKSGTAQYTYTFKSWDKEISDVTGDVTYTAVFDSIVNEYEIAWNTGKEIIKETLAYGADIAYKGSEPTKDATDEFTYSFDRWTDSTGKSLTEGAKVAGDAAYTAQFTANKRSYEITWLNDDGTELKKETLEYGTMPSYGGIPEKSATDKYTYTFAGWDKEVKEVTGNAEYKATYNSVINKYTVIWQNEDKTELEREDVEYGKVPVYGGSTPTKEGNAEFTYTFSGWTPAVSEVTGNVTYTAVYTETRNKYDVIWKNYDGTTLETDEAVPYGELAVYNGAAPTKDSSASTVYTFTGWTAEDGTAFEEGVTTVGGKLVFTAQYSESVRQYTVTWKNGDNVIKEEKVDYGTVPKYNGEIPVKEQTNEFYYTFSGWKTSGGAVLTEETTVTGDTTYEAQFTAETRSYDIKWYDEDGTTLLSTTNVKYGETPVFDKAEPMKEKTAQYTYTFAGWAAGSGETVTGVTAVTGEASYKAVYTAVVNKYNITWLNWNGEELEKDEAAAYGTKPSYDGNVPAREADTEKVYTFSGWISDSGSELTEDIIVTGDVTYTAQFTDDARKYEITWLNEDGTELYKSETAYGTMPVYGGETPEKESTAEFNYSFKGWSPEMQNVTGTAIYTAEYEESVRKYTVTWLDEDGSELRKDTVEYGKVPEYGAVPVKEATAQYTYTFAGWDKDPAAVTDDAVYKAVYESEINKYTVLWLNEDGSELERDENVTYGALASYDGATPAKEATAQYTYEFAGWDKAPAEVEGNIVYTATYSSKVNKYKVTWLNYDGTLLEEDKEVEYGMMPSYDGADPVKTEDAQYSYTFIGWDKTVSAVTCDVTYTAQFANSDAKMYTVTWYDEDGETVLYTKEVAYGEIPVYGGETPEKEGNAQYSYTFSGWSPAESEVTGNAAYIAQYSESVNRYTVTWYDEDGITVLASESFAYGTIPEYTGETPTKENFENYIYTFDGWTEELGEVTGNTSYTAKYEAHILGAPETEITAPATCEEDGSYDVVVRCTICGDEFSRESVAIPAHGHDLQLTQVNEEDCITEEDGDLTEYFKCRFCGKCFIDEEGITEITIHKHEYEAEVKSELDCETDGVTVYTCSRCGHSYEDVVKALGHKYTEPEWTWSEDGSSAEAVFKCENDNNEKWTEEADITFVEVEEICTGEEQVTYPLATVTFNGQTYTDTNGEVPSPSGHTYRVSEWIWDGYENAAVVFTCIYGDDEQQAEAEITSETIVAMNCREGEEADGLIRHTAAAEYEGQTYRDVKEETVASAHEYVHTVITEATCTAPGIYEDTCNICGHSERGDIGLLDHTEVIDPRVEPTETEIGWTEGSHCSVCGAVLVLQQEIPKTGGGSTGGSGGSGGGGGGGFVPTTPPADDTTTIVDDRTPLADKPFMFEDVAEKDWFRDSAYYVYQNDMMKGLSETKFGPHANLNRAMIVTILYRLEGEPDVQTASKFNDVKSGEWYSDAIAWAAANDIVTGYDPVTFGPANNITREQLATILYRYAQYKKYDAAESAALDAFADSDSASVYAKEALGWGVGTKLINGKDGKLVPTDNASRAEAAAMMMRFCEKYVGTEEPNTQRITDKSEKN